jgi:hypothetical protein
MELPTLVKVVLALLPRVVMAPMHTTMMRHGVLDRGRAVFGLQELDDVLRELTHGTLSPVWGNHLNRTG